MPDPQTTLEAGAQRLKQLERLLEVSRKLSSMLDLDPLLQTIIEEAASLTNSQEASILLYDQHEQMLKFVAVPWAARDKMRDLRVPLDDSISGHVYKTGQTAIVPNAKQDERFFDQIDQQRDFETETLLVVPLMFQGKPTGVLTAVNKQGEASYTPEDVWILETLASQASIAINNASLLQRSQEAYQDLAELDRRKSDFIAITSHELRTPLGLILGHATFIKEMVPPDLQEQMEVIVRSTMRLKGVVEDLSKVNNFQTGQARLRWREINLRELLEEIARTFEPAAQEKGLVFELQLPRKALVLEGDGEKIGIAISHLVRNAITFTDEGGIRLSAEELPGYMRISVADTGLGIPEKDQMRVFERFYQVESHMTRRHGGMGLGLSVAKMMVEMHSGRITLNSIEGRGSTFTLLFPRAAMDMSAANDLLNPKTEPAEK